MRHSWCAAQSNLSFCASPLASLVFKLKTAVIFAMTLWIFSCAFSVFVVNQIFDKNLSRFCSNLALRINIWSIIWLKVVFYQIAVLNKKTILYDVRFFCLIKLVSRWMIDVMTCWDPPQLRNRFLLPQWGIPRGDWYRCHNQAHWGHPYLMDSHVSHLLACSLHPTGPPLSWNLLWGVWCPCEVEHVDINCPPQRGFNLPRACVPVTLNRVLYLGLRNSDGESGNTFHQQTRG